MLDVHKNDREVSNLMLAGLSREYYHLRETLNVIFRNNPLGIETHVRERYLDLQTENTMKTAGVALAAKVQKKNSAKTKPKRSNFDSGATKVFRGKCFKCQETGHIAKDCLARVLPHPSQTGKSEDSKEADGGEN